MGERLSNAFFFNLHLTLWYYIFTNACDITGPLNPSYAVENTDVMVSLAVRARCLVITRH